MPIRRRAFLTREGWYYLALLAFVLGGSVIRSGNLLLILAGMMVGPLIFNWRLVIAGMTGLVVKRHVPASIVAGEPLAVEFRVENTKWWLSTWLLRIDDRVQRVEEKNRKAGNPSKPVAGTTLIPHIPAGGSATGIYRLTLHRRGQYRLGPLRCGTRFPLGLVRGQISLPYSTEMIVVPRLGRLLPAWASVMEAEQLGDERRHPQRGVSEGEYYGLRPWQSGDSLRWIHWRTTAKLARPIVRQYERRRSRDVAIILDPWLPASATPDDEALGELAISFTATALHDISIRGNSRLTLTVGSREPECFSGPSSPPFCRELLEYLARVPLHHDSSLAAALNQTLEAAPSGTRIVVISPRSANDGSLIKNALEIDLDPDDLAWIDVSSDQLTSLFTLDA